MPKRKIMQGDWFMSKGGFVFNCKSQAGGVFGYYSHRVKDCTRLPVSPKDLMKLWRLAKKMEDANSRIARGALSEWVEAEKSIYRLIKKAKRKGIK